MKVHTYCTCFNSSSSYTHPKISALPHVPPHVMQHTNESHTLALCEAARTALYLACQSVNQSINQLRWIQISNAGGHPRTYEWKQQKWSYLIMQPQIRFIFKTVNPSYIPCLSLAFITCKCFLASLTSHSLRELTQDKHTQGISHHIHSPRLHV